MLIDLTLSDDEEVGPIQPPTIVVNHGDAEGRVQQWGETGHGLHLCSAQAVSEVGQPPEQSLHPQPPVQVVPSPVQVVPQQHPEVSQGSDSEDDLNLSFLQPCRRHGGSVREGSGAQQGTQQQPLLAPSTLPSHNQQPASARTGRCGQPVTSQMLPTRCEGTVLSSVCRDPDFASQTQLPLSQLPLEVSKAARGGSQAAQQRGEGSAGLEATAAHELDKEAAKAAKAAERQEAKRRREEEKAAEREAKRVERERAKAEKAAAAEAQKAAKKADKDIQRAMSGAGAERLHLVRVSPRAMEGPSAQHLLQGLVAAGCEYKVDVVMPLGAEYECIRWARRMPRAAAAVFFEGTAAPEVVAPPGSDPHNPHQEVEVLYPLVLLLLPPDQLCAQLAGGAMLRPLRDAMRGAHPECTLMVGCVGLERHLVREEQVPGGNFNSATIHDALMDVSLNFPAVRLRTDLKDGSQLADFVATTTRCLALQHKKQQEGYLKAFGEDKVSSRDLHLEGETLATKTLAHALSQLLRGGDKAIALAKKFRSAAALLRAVSDPELSVREREARLVGITLAGGRAGTIGAKVAKDLVDFFTNTNPDAPWREGAGAD